MRLTLPQIRKTQYLARDILKTQGQISVRFFSSCSSSAALIKYVKTGKSTFTPPPPPPPLALNGLLINEP